jgi:hypothetical protein
MEWLGTGFVLTVGGVRLRVRIALEDTPCEPPAPLAAPAPAPHLHEHSRGSSRVHRPR